jgi:hypothetical protein
LFWRGVTAVSGGGEALRGGSAMVCPEETPFGSFDKEVALVYR